MLKKGFVFVIPLVFISAIIFSASAIGVLISNQDEANQKAKVGKVLSESDSDDESNSGSGKNSQESQKESDQKADESRKESSKIETKNSSSGSSNKSQKLEIEKEKDKVKIKSKNELTGFESETEVEDGKEKTKIKFGGIKIEYERQGDEIVTKFKDENGEELEFEASEEAEILDELEDEFEDDDIKIATGSADTGFIQKGRRVRTNFPLSINPTTGELFVTTPSGTKVVAVLPEQAVQNMIAAGVITRVEEPPVPTPPESTESANIISVDSAPIEIAEVNNTPAYVINGVKVQKVFGVIPVDFKIKTYVSVADGSLIDIEQGFFSRILDLISF